MIENKFKKKKILIFKYFDLGLSRTKLVKLAYKLIADLPKIGTALLIKFGVKFADFVLEHKLQKRISNR
jgi:hypothetical protein